MARSSTSVVRRTASATRRGTRSRSSSSASALPPDASEQATIPGGRVETASFDATLPVRAPDARWFPVDLHVPERRFDMAMFDVEVLERSTFLDTRLDATLASIEHVPADRFAGLPPQRAPAWLFHTSFCGSTLLAR